MTEFEPTQCQLCENIDTKYRRRSAEMDRLKSWKLQGSTHVGHIDRSQKLIQALDKEIYQLQREREDRRKCLSGSTDGSTPKNPEELPVSNDQDRKKLLSGNAEGSTSKNPEELRRALTEALVLTAKHEFVEAARCEEYMRKAYGKVGAKLLQHIIIALENGTGHSGCSDMDVELGEKKITVISHKALPDVSSALLWLCLAIRQPQAATLSISTANMKYECQGKATLEALTEFKPHSNQADCWQNLFDSAIIAIEPSTSKSSIYWLHLDFEDLLQISAVEYAVNVGSGLILMGYSSALIPMGACDSQTMTWHVEICPHASQFKVSEVQALNSAWLKTLDIEQLKLKHARVGWVSGTAVLLGTEKLPPTVRWSKAKQKPVRWSWKGANLQAVVSSTSPLQLGLQGAVSFERLSCTVRLSPSGNYLRLLNSSVGEAVIIYDTEERRAWLVSLLSVLHHMVLVYCRDSSGFLKSRELPFAEPQPDGGQASWTTLRGSGDVLIQQEGTDKLTLRDLVMGFSINFAKTTVQKPRLREIYGYEFMDIVHNSPTADLKTINIERTGLSWTPLLQSIPCLFSSRLGDAIVGSKALTENTHCNKLVPGQDLMAASIHCINNISQRQGGSDTGPYRLHPGGYIWKIKGRPFLDCERLDEKCTCWENRSFLQHISKQGQLLNRECPTAEVCTDGAVVFGKISKSIIGSVVESLCGRVENASCSSQPASSSS
ncbi:hypothetical protein ASPTUDRAFT_49777 [Aspergillus tubingensis CBS 134.48]|uniref:Uncharacterized protein n=1 Tax=Aspergillus tubingensis (strain CBS 134.48) TaxID=767770 RepID=A0A1L9NHY2_ASPTC|nr:hypothetical protein ASPTUDRAFT_49777 [Aspergillus tubingensis CBS 134.48]